MEIFSESSLASVLGKIFTSRKDVEQLLANLKEKDRAFKSITRSANGKPKKNPELLADISQCRPSGITEAKGLFNWMVEVSFAL
jgi:hypothetical protein